MCKLDHAEQMKKLGSQSIVAVKQYLFVCCLMGCMHVAAAGLKSSQMRLKPQATSCSMLLRLWVIEANAARLF